MLGFYFDEGSRAAVLEALASFQNPDGGFGHALEPDVRLDDSSVIATTMALQTLRKVGADGGHALVRGAVGYLLEHLDHEALAWSLVPEDVDRAPHAPWWNPEEPPAAFTANPGAEVVGYFHEWAPLVPAALLAHLTEAAMEHLRGLDEAPMHDLLCYESMRRSRGLPEGLRREMAGLMRPLVLRAVETDPAKWGSYCLKPLQVVDSPGSAYHADFREAVEVELDTLVDGRDPDGAWPVNWSWGPDGGEAWERSEREWRGAIAVDHLRTLRRFGRIESVD